jgi:DNA-directed RNA polymerase specialized sigma24 family protein
VAASSTDRDKTVTTLTGWGSGGHATTGQHGQNGVDLAASDHASPRSDNNPPCAPAEHRAGKTAQTLPRSRQSVASSRRRLPVVAVDDQAAMGELYQRWVAELVERHRVDVGDDDAALELVHEAFAWALAHFVAVHTDVLRAIDKRIRDTVYERSARNPHVRDRHGRSRIEASSSTADPAALVEDRDTLTTVVAGLHLQERVYLLQWLSGLSSNEIATRNQRAPGTVRAHLTHARAHARRLREAGETLLGLFVGWRWIHRAMRRGDATAAKLREWSIDQVSSTLVLGLAALITSVPSSAASHALAAVKHPVAAVIAPHVPSGQPHVAVTAPRWATTAPDIAASHRDVVATLGGWAPHLPGAASSETPEDTRIVDAAPSPEFDQDKTLLALGVGATCNCTVLMRSTDAGYSWEASPSALPSGVSEIVLPSGYPRDGRIFLAGPAQNAAPPYVSNGFDGPFAAIPGLPPGLVTLSSAFDDGDPRIFVAGTGGVYADDLTSSRVSLAVAEVEGAVPSLAKAEPNSPTAVVVLGTASSFAVGSGSVAAPLSNGPDRLFDCPVGSAPCEQVGALTAPSGGLQLARRYGFAAAPALAVFGGSDLRVSSDGGRTFRVYSAPAGAQGLAGVAILTTGAASRLWADVTEGGVAKPEWNDLRATGGAWTRADGDGLDHQGQLVPINQSLILFLPPDRGFRCTTDGGMTWSSRCISGG